MVIKLNLQVMQKKFVIEEFLITKQLPQSQKEIDELASNFLNRLQNQRKEQEKNEENILKQVIKNTNKEILKKVLKEYVENEMKNNDNLKV